MSAPAHHHNVYCPGCNTTPCQVIRPAVAASSLSELEFNPSDYERSSLAATCIKCGSMFEAATRVKLPLCPKCERAVRPFQPDLIEEPAHDGSVLPRPPGEGSVSIEARKVTITITLDAHDLSWSGRGEIEAFLQGGSVSEPIPAGVMGDSPKKTFERLALVIGNRLRVFR